MIFTFYSYKGGVGRSMALAEVAARLAERNLKVLAIDFDLEAPGLERYFFDTERSRQATAQPGLIELIASYRHALTNQAAFAQAEFQHLERFWQPAIHRAGQEGGGSVHLMTAGKREPAQSMAEYVVTVRNFDWQDFFTNWRGDLFFEWLRTQLTKGAAAYDVVLVDSRTGVTEMGGVCAYQLADAVVVLCGPNYQNLAGTRAVVRDFMSPGVMGLRRGRPLEILALPSRLDPNHPKRAEFLSAFTAELGVDAMPKSLADNGLDYAKLALPYLPEYSVAEQPVGTNTTTSGVFDQLVDALTLLADADTPLGRQQAEARNRLNGTLAANLERLAADTTKSSAGYDVFLDYGDADREDGAALRVALEQTGLKVFDPLGSTSPQAASLITALEYSRALLVCFGQSSSSQFRTDLIAKARRLKDVKIAPVLLPSGETSALRSFGLDVIQAIDLTQGSSGAWAGIASIQSLLAFSDHSDRVNPPIERFPYVGAQPYGESDAKYFSGRDDEIARLYDAIAAHYVVFVSGAAQVGKTSVVQAGLLPRLRQANAATTPSFYFDSIVSIDTANPSWADSARVGMPTGLSPDQAARHLIIIDSADTFLTSGQEVVGQRVGTLVEAIRGAAEQRYKLIVVWRDTLAEVDRQAVLDASGPTGVGQVTIERLANTCLEQAIEQPALRAGHLLEPGLTQRLVESAGGAQNAILQIQLALSTIWPLRQRGWLTNKHLDQVGHLGGVFQSHLTSILSTLTSDERRAADVMFKCMAQLDSTLKLVPVPEFWGLLANVPAIASVDAVVLRDRLATHGLIDLRREALPGYEEIAVQPPGGRKGNVPTDLKVALVRPNAMRYFGGGEVIPDVRFFIWRRGQFAGDRAKWRSEGRRRALLLKGSALSEAEDWLSLRKDEISLLEREFIEASIASREGQAVDDAEEPVEKALASKALEQVKTTAHGVLMLQVNDAMARSDFGAARTLLRAAYDLAKNEAPQQPVDTYIVQRLVLATYKSKFPTELAALNEALTLLSQLEPDTSHDPETLGLAAAIHKRLWNLTGDVAHLDLAVRATDRGFSLRDDYYNGINLAFLLNTRAARSQIPAEAVADFVLAERVRHTVVDLCDRWLEANTASAQNADPRYWVLATRAEALVGLGDASATRSLDAAYAAAPAAWMADSTKQQIAALSALLRDSPLKHLEPTPGAVSLDTRTTGGSLSLPGLAGPSATSAPQITATTVPPPPANVAPPAASNINVRRALCVGIDAYPGSNRLTGCVNDTRIWSSALKSAGFDVVTLTDTDATHAAIVAALNKLVANAKQGDVLVFQYSGHGTELPGVGSEDADSLEQAFVPFDFETGAFLTGDDVRAAFGPLPRGSNLTAFFDCCHSGFITRVLGPHSSENPEQASMRYLKRTKDWNQWVLAHNRFRRHINATQAAPQGTDTSVASWISYTACRSDEVAFERNSNGDFTLRAARLLTSGITRFTNRTFLEAVIAGLGGEGRRQTPQLDCADSAKDLPFLQPLPTAVGGLSITVNLS